MEFDKSKVFTVFNCDEVKVGSKGYIADYKDALISRVQSEDKEYYLTIKNIESVNDYSFRIGNGALYRYFYLVEEPTMKEKQLTMYELNQLLKCFGVECYANNTFIYNDVLYEHNDSNKEISVNYKIRYKQGKWEEPTRVTVFKWWCKDKPDSDIARLVSFFGWNVDKE